MKGNRRWLFLLSAVLFVACGDDSGTTDAGELVDSSAEVDVPPSCTMDSECDDGLFCTGVEACIDGMCAATERLGCDDGIACTLDRCSEERRECVSSPPDEDGDGHAAAQCLDDAGEPLGDDCDDSDANRYPGNREVCDSDGHDEDCSLDTLGVLDADGDGFLSVECCNPDGSGGVACGPDCDDARPTINPSSTEVCDNFDNDCDSMVDEGVALDGFVDADRDGFGGATPLRSCAEAVGFSTRGDDCDDTDVAVRPGQAELCDSVDNDCDTAVDEATEDSDWYLDGDSDGYGDRTAEPVPSCMRLVGYSLLNTDCDDARADISPLAAEMCDGLDNDCNGAADFLIGVNDTEDDDLDGLVDIACTPLGTDCDDRNANVGPGEPEECDGRDNDCDLDIDEGADGTVWYADLDRDGYGAEASGTVISCLPVTGYRRAGGDCDDRSRDRNPAATEVCNGLDDDCDLLVDDGAPAPAGCMPEGAPGICLAGGCGVGDCAAGAADCDGNATNGCEAVLGSRSHCGGCFDRCAAAQGTAECVSGSCELETCTAGWGNCDDNDGNGCEQFLSVEEHCGGCDMRCRLAEGFACVSGVCVPFDCPSGTDDCNGVSSDGCETTLGTLSDCRRCGDFCDDTNATASCTVSGCRLACDAGFADCNRDPADGCEANLDTDPNRCGSCNHRCDQTGGMTSCVSGSCQVVSCDVGRDDCNLTGDDGCETDTATSRNDCGGCGAFCELPNATELCMSSVCQIIACDSGFEDCDDDPITGCETDIARDRFNCGACGTPCDPANGFGSCMGTCRVDGCDPGFSDCDGTASTGCEASLDTDPNNCGGCGVQCGFGRTCSASGCEEIVSVAAGASASCLVLAGGAVVCQGDNQYGQLGDGTTTDSRLPRTVRTAATPIFGAVEVSVGERHACARTTTEIYCWGGNNDGQVGDGTSTNRSFAVPVPLPPSDVPVKITAGRNHTCALLATGAVYCWGGDGSGQVGTGGGTGFVTMPGRVPNLVTPLFARDLSAGNDFTCAVDFAGVPSCWGRNVNGELGTGFVSAEETVPQLFSGGGTFDRVTQIAAGGFHACAVRQVAGPRLHCWGQNTNGQLGVTGGSTSTPVLVSPPFGSARTVATGRTHTCAVDTLGRLYCFGNNANGQVGVGSLGGSFTSPQNIGGGYLAVFSGSFSDFSFATATSGAVLGWGANADQQIGLATPANVVAPTSSPGL